MLSMLTNKAVWETQNRRTVVPQDRKTAVRWCHAYKQARAPALVCLSGAGMQAVEGKPRFLSRGGQVDRPNLPAGCLAGRQAQVAQLRGWRPRPDLLAVLQRRARPYLVGRFN